MEQNLAETEQKVNDACKQIVEVKRSQELLFKLKIFEVMHHD